MLSASSRSRWVSARMELPRRGGPIPPTDSRLAGLAFDCISQRLQSRPIFLSALYRGLVDRLAHLGDARRLHRPVGFVELKAFVVPVEPEEFDQCLRFL